MVCHCVVERGVEQGRCSLLVVALRFVGEPGMVGCLVRGTAPGTYDIERVLARLGLAEGEPHRLHTGGRGSRTEQDPVVGNLQSGLVAG